MLHLAGLYFFRDATLQTHSNFYLGLGTGAGIDFFVAESVALGIRATVDFYFDLKPSLMAALGGAFTATTSF